MFAPGNPNHAQLGYAWLEDATESGKVAPHMADRHAPWRQTGPAGSMKGGERAIGDRPVQSAGRWQLDAAGGAAGQAAQAGQVGRVGQVRQRRHLPNDRRPDDYPVAAVVFSGEKIGVGAADETREVFFVCVLDNPKARRVVGQSSDRDGGIEPGTECVEGSRPRSRRCSPGER